MENESEPSLPSLEARLLELVSGTGYRPLKPKQIAKKLDLSEEERHELRRLVKRLVKRGRLSWGVGHLVQSLREEEAAGGAAGAVSEPVAAGRETVAVGDGVKSRERSGEIVGTFKRTDRGFGFVRPQQTSGTREEDVYISASNAHDAASGDVVRVKMLPRGARREGKIVEIVERDTHQFVGTYFESGGAGFVQVDGTLFAHPVCVGDPGAKNAQPDDKVVFEMVRFPSHFHGGEGVITEILGARGAPGVDTQTIVKEYNLPEAFAEDAMEEARRQAEQFQEEVIAPRVDLTGMTIITIDPVDARDFDDAISLERIEKGHWRLGVHIADVSHFVRSGTALDREAHARGTSVYLPDKVIPMLPEVISNGLASLQPDRVRYTKTAFLEFTPEGAYVGVDLQSAAIKSVRRFTYEEVDEYLADPAGWQKKLTPEVHGLLGRMHELAMILRQRRMERGSLELSMNEVKVDLDKDGRVVGAHLVENTVSHQIIEEFMLAANEAVARRLKEQEWHFLRRVHDAPDPRKLKTLTEFVKELGLKTESLESRFELQTLLKRVVGTPQQHAVNYALLRSLQRAVYSPREEGHYALASDCYCHFTSPIRRYPDLTIHRLFDALVEGKKPVNDFGALVGLGMHCSDLEQRAEAAERELTKMKLLGYFADRLGEEMDAVVTGVESFGLFVQGIELPAEGLVHISSLADDYYQYDRASHTLSGRRPGNTFRLGDVVRVAVAHVDVDRRELDFRLVGRGAREGLTRAERRGTPQRPETQRPGKPEMGARGRKERQPSEAPKKKRKTPRQLKKAKKKKRHR
jgi:ribonuclease R